MFNTRGNIWLFRKGKRKYGLIGFVFITNREYKHKTSVYPDPPSVQKTTPINTYA